MNYIYALTVRHKICEIIFLYALMVNQYILKTTVTSMCINGRSLHIESNEKIYVLMVHQVHK